MYKTRHLHPPPLHHYTVLVFTMFLNQRTQPPDDHIPQGTEQASTKKTRNRNTCQPCYDQLNGRKRCVTLPGETTCEPCKRNNNICVPKKPGVRSRSNSTPIDFTDLAQALGHKLQGIGSQLQQILQPSLNALAAANQVIASYAEPGSQVPQPYYILEWNGSNTTYRVIPNHYYSGIGPQPNGQLSLVEPTSLSQTPENFDFNVSGMSGQIGANTSIMQLGQQPTQTPSFEPSPALADHSNFLNYSVCDARGQMDLSASGGDHVQGISEPHFNSSISSSTMRTDTFDEAGATPMSDEEFTSFLLDKLNNLNNPVLEQYPWC